ncbi:hypothetical protein COCNU_scaffold017399G000030 [Cocos nucifera]|nr:hypothetical protein [Cocos nucifera]
MPELRSGVRRGRAQANPIVQAERPTAARRRRTARNEALLVDENLVNTSAEPREGIRLLEGGDEVGALVGEEIKVGIGERKMDDYESGAKSADKLPGGEDEGSTAPFPEKLCGRLGHDDGCKFSPKEKVDRGHGIQSENFFTSPSAMDGAELEGEQSVTIVRPRMGPWMATSIIRQPKPSRVPMEGKASDSNTESLALSSSLSRPNSPRQPASPPPDPDGWQKPTKFARRRSPGKTRISPNSARVGIAERGAGFGCCWSWALLLRRCWWAWIGKSKPKPIGSIYGGGWWAVPDPTVSPIIDEAYRTRGLYFFFYRKLAPSQGGVEHALVDEAHRSTGINTPSERLVNRQWRMLGVEGQFSTARVAVIWSSVR